MGRGKTKYPGGSATFPGGGTIAALSTGSGTTNIVVPRALAYAAELFARARHASRSETLADLLGRGDPMALNLKEDLQFKVEGEAADVTIGQLWDLSNAKRLTLLAAKLPVLLSFAEKVFLEELRGDDQYWTASPTDESVFPPRRRLEDMNFNQVDKCWKRIAPLSVAAF